jgi:hypothetical protein
MSSPNSDSSSGSSRDLHRIDGYRERSHTSGNGAGRVNNQATGLWGYSQRQTALANGGNGPIGATGSNGVNSASNADGLNRSRTQRETAPRGRPLNRTGTILGPMGTAYGAYLRQRAATLAATEHGTMANAVTTNRAIPQLEQNNRANDGVNNINTSSIEAGRATGRANAAGSTTRSVNATNAPDPFAMTLPEELNWVHGNSSTASSPRHAQAEMASNRYYARAHRALAEANRAREMEETEYRTTTARRADVVPRLLAYRTELRNDARNRSGRLADTDLPALWASEDDMRTRALARVDEVLRYIEDASGRTGREARLEALRHRAIASRQAREAHRIEVAQARGEALSSSSDEDSAVSRRRHNSLQTGIADINEGSLRRITTPELFEEIVDRLTDAVPEQRSAARTRRERPPRSGDVLVLDQSYYTRGEGASRSRNQRSDGSNRNGGGAPNGHSAARNDQTILPAVSYAPPISIPARVNIAPIANMAPVTQMRPPPPFMVPSPQPNAAPGYVVTPSPDDHEYIPADAIPEGTAAIVVAHPDIIGSLLVVTQLGAYEANIDGAEGHRSRIFAAQHGVSPDRYIERNAHVPTIEMRVSRELASIEDDWRAAAWRMLRDANTIMAHSSVFDDGTEARQRLDLALRRARVDVTSSATGLRSLLREVLEPSSGSGLDGTWRFA